MEGLVGLIVLGSAGILCPPLLRWAGTAFRWRRNANTRWRLLVPDLLLMVVVPLVWCEYNSGSESYGCCDNDAALLHGRWNLAVMGVLAAGGLAFLVLSRTARRLPPLLEAALTGCMGAGAVLAGLLAYQGAELALPGIAAWILNVLWASWMRSRVQMLAFARRRPPGDLWRRRSLRTAAARGMAGTSLLLLGSTGIASLVSLALEACGWPFETLMLAFTQTYTHPLSRLAYDCSQVECTGMYLVTIGERGHAAVVGPTRAGWRAGKPIRCSRQLLVSNAFEASLAHRLPAVQRLGRRLYDRMGTHLDPNRALFRSPWLCDAVHLAMKPAEWAFLLWLYLVEPEPEALIGRQYLPT